MTAIDVTSGEEGVATAVTVTATNMNYDDGFKVYVGGEEAEVTLRQLSKFRFKVPTTLSAGSYDIVVYNGTGSTALTIGQYTYTQAAAADELEVSAIDVTSGEEGVATAVTVTAKNMNYDDGFKVYVGGEEAEVTLTQLSKFRFKVPTTLSAGSYDIVVYNGTGSTALTIGQYTYTAVLDEYLITVTDISATSGAVGSGVTVTVTAKGMKYYDGDGLKVYVGGVEATIKLRQTTKFRFVTPTSLSAGTYDIVVYNGGSSVGQKIGTYTYN